MLDPALCQRPPSQWISLKFLISDWLTEPWIMISTLGILAALPWLVRRWPRKRLFSAAAAALLVLYLIAPLPPVIALAEWGLTAALPKDSGRPTDAIVVLGRGLPLGAARVNTAFRLWQANRAPRVFTSGENDAQPMAEMLINKGIPAAAVAFEGCSRTTEENARFTAAMLQPEGVKTILLVTDPPHMLRSLLTFNSLGFEVVPHVSEVGQEHLTTALDVFREYVGLVSYGIKGRFLPRQSPELRA